MSPASTARPSLRIAAVLIVLTAALTSIAAVAGAHPAVRAHAAATCADYPEQAAAQRAADTRDSDGDGRYCEDLPCPCAGPGGPASAPAPSAPGPSQRRCERPRGVQRIAFSKARYPHIRAHFRTALRHGWPRTLVLDRAGADARRERLLQDIPTRPGLDRDEYPPAVARGEGKGLERGRRPRGWMADVAYVPSAENRSHGATLGSRLRRFCDGTRFRYVFH